jgi:hypothetical protein
MAGLGGETEEEIVAVCGDLNPCSSVRATVRAKSKWRRREF